RKQRSRYLPGRCVAIGRNWTSSFRPSGMLAARLNTSAPSRLRRTGLPRSTSRWCGCRLPTIGAGPILRYLTARVEAAKLPEESQRAAFAWADELLPRLHPLAGWLVANVSGPPRFFLLCRLDLRAAARACAAERYRAKYRRWPECLEDLDPEFLAQVPLDPVDGADLRLRRRPDGLVVGSAGTDGSNPGQPARPRLVQTDWMGRGVQLWDVPARRQPPPPATCFPKELDLPSPTRTLLLTERTPADVRLAPEDVAYLSAVHAGRFELLPTGQPGQHRITPRGYVGVVVAPRCRLALRAQVAPRSLRHLLPPVRPRPA